jgi:hypothetical protein
MMESFRDWKLKVRFVNVKNPYILKGGFVMCRVLSDNCDVDGTIQAGASF